MENFNEDGVHGENITERVFSTRLQGVTGYNKIMVAGNTRSDISDSAIENRKSGDGRFLREIHIEVKNSNRISETSFKGFKGDYFLFNTYSMGRVFALKNSKLLHHFVSVYLNKQGVYRCAMPSSNDMGYLFRPGELRSMELTCCGVDLCDEIMGHEAAELFEMEKKRYRSEMETKK